MKKQLLLTRMLLLVALLVGSVSAWGENVTVISENFNDGTATGWTLTGKTSYSGSAGAKSLQIASNSGTGSAKTPAFTSLVGTTATLTFSHKSTGTSARTLTITGNDCKVNGKTSTTVNVPTTWDEASINITDASKTSTITFSAASGQGTLIDDVLIYYTTGPASPLAHITLSGTYPTTFTVGDAFSHEGMVVTATYEDESSKNVTSDAEFSGYNMNTLGNQTVTVSYTENAVVKTAVYQIAVNPYIQPLSVNITPNYTFYGKDAQFSGNTNDKVTGTKDNITVTYTRNEGSCYANENAMRFYKDNDLKISAPDGYHIIGIELTVSGSYTGEITTDVGSYSTEHDKWSGNASSVTFSRPSNASSYATISKIAVTLAPKVTITAAKYATFSSPYRLNFEGSNVKAYKAISTDGESVTLVEMTVVDANVGVLLHAETADTYYIPSTSAAATSAAGNLLQSTATAAHNIAADEVGRAYVFGKFNDTEVGFFKAAEGKTIDASKSYLLLDTPPANNANFLSFVFGDEEQGETDGIKAVSTKVENGVRYNLAGQKVGADYKGIVIVNGKKYLRK